TLTYHDHFVLSLSRADAALVELSGLGRHFPNPHLLIAPYVRREAVLSSCIEGTRASLSASMSLPIRFLYPNWQGWH
ncbi:MAG: Fic/DOC family N-terminal domain-containing protein, partial [Nitrospira sp.]